MHYFSQFKNVKLKSGNVGAEPGRREEEGWRIGRGEESSFRNSLNPLVSNSPPWEGFI
jgi:hypothetical protein